MIRPFIITSIGFLGFLGFFIISLIGFQPAFGQNDQGFDQRYTATNRISSNLSPDIIPYNNPDNRQKPTLYNESNYSPEELDRFFRSSHTYTGTLSNTLTPIKGWGQLTFGMSYQSVFSNFQILHPNLQLVKPSFPDIEETINYYYLTTFKDTFYQKIDFQFNKNKELYLIRLSMSPRFFSFLKLYKGIYLRYGPPIKNSFQQITWKSTNNYLTLTRDSVLTYFSDDYSASSNTNFINKSILDPREKVDTIIDGL